MEDDGDFFGQLGEGGDPAVQQRLFDEAAALSGKGSTASSFSSSGAPKRTKAGPTVAEVTLLMEQARKEAEDAAKTWVLPKAVEVAGDGSPAEPSAQHLG